MEKRKEQKVVVFGSHRLGTTPNIGTGLHAKAPQKIYEAAREFIKDLCERYPHLTIVTGGGQGIMEAANRGAREAGSKSIGYPVTFLGDEETNEYMDESYPCDDFSTRKAGLMSNIDYCLVFPGGLGTLDELFEVLTLVQTGQLPSCKRVILVDLGDDFWFNTFNLAAMVAIGALDIAQAGVLEYRTFNNPLILE